MSPERKRRPGGITACFPYTRKMAAALTGNPALAAAISIGMYTRS